MIQTQVEGTDDAADYAEMMSAMTTMNLSGDDQSEILQLVSGILHLGNINFREEGAEKAVIEMEQREFDHLRSKQHPVPFFPSKNRDLL